MNREQSRCASLPEQFQLPLAMAYVPMQRFGETYPPEVALHKGTLFPDLDKPFCGRTIMGGGRNG